jgi:hypothetical protein
MNDSIQTPLFTSEITTSVISKSHIAHIADIVQDRDVHSVLEKLFHLQRRGTTWTSEVLCGVIQFVSCMYILPVVPLQLADAGFDTTATINATVMLMILPPVL